MNKNDEDGWAPLSALPSEPAPPSTIGISTGHRYNLNLVG